jgi:RNA polymerase sigma-70 factor (ECF subfamily)
MNESPALRPEPGGIDRERMTVCLQAVARSESREAFAELFDVFAPRVKSYLMRLGCSDGQAEEITQDVMLTVWRKAAQYDPSQASASTWIFRIARNRRIDVFRRQNRPALDPEETALHPSVLPAPGDALDQQEAETAVRDALRELPPEQLSLVRAAFYEGLSHTEIAARFDLALGTVKSRIRLAFNRLRRKLADGDDPD